jgi:hypothetical protein
VMGECEIVTQRQLISVLFEERLKTKAEESIRLTYTGLLGELEHLKIKTTLTGEMFASAMGETLKLFRYVYYESRKRELKTKLIYENRCDERLQS